MSQTKAEAVAAFWRVMTPHLVDLHLAGELEGEDLLAA